MISIQKWFNVTLVKPKAEKNKLYTDEELCRKVLVENCSESFNALYERHVKLFSSISSKIIGFAHINHDEFVSNKYNILFETIKSFKPEMKVKFSTWLANQIRYFCLNLNNKTNRMVLTEDATLIFLF